MPVPSSRSRTYFVVALCLILAFGIFLRIPSSVFSGPDAPLRFLSALHPAAKFDQIGFDEGLYRKYVSELSVAGLAGYPDIVDRYIEVQKR